jgi:excisionase family DNA binding protein
MAAKKLPSYRRLGNVIPNRRYLTTKELANLMGKSQRYVRRLAKEGKIPARKQGRNWIITYEEGIATTRRLAVKLDLSPSYIRQLLRKGLIPGGVKVGRNWIYPYDRQPEDIYVRRRGEKRGLAEKRLEEMDGDWMG